VMHFKSSAFLHWTPPPGRSSMGMPGRDDLLHRDTQAVVVIFLQLFRSTNPVTRLFSTANCNLRDVVKVSSFNSPTTADSEPHLRASSIAQEMCCSLFRSTKMIRWGSMPKCFNAGAKIFLLALIHTVTP